MPNSPSIATKAARGAFLLLATQAFQLGLQFVGDIVLARLISPADFGRVAMVMTVTSLAMQFKDFGLSAATIQAHDLTNSQSSNLFWCNVTVSAILTGCICAAAPLVQIGFGKPHLAAITVALASCILFAGLGVQHQAQLVRQLRFGAISRAQLIGLVAGYVAAIIGAYAGLHHWALVILQTVRHGVATLGLYAAYPWLPQRPLRNQGSWSHIRFGSSLAGFDLVNYFSRNVDKLLIGRIGGEAALGQYNRAYQLLLLPIAQVRGPIAAAGMPLLSSLQHQPVEFRRLYLGMVSLVASVSLPIMAWLAVHSLELTRILFGEAWLPSAEYFRLLSLAGLGQPTVGLLGLLLVTLGRGARYFQWGCWHAGAMVVSFLIGSLWGISGICIAYAIANLLVAIPSARFCTHLSPVSTRDFLSTHVVPGVFTAAAAGTSWLITSIWPDKRVYLRLGVGSAAFAVVYLAQFLVLPSRVEDVRWLIRALRRRHVVA